MGIIQLPMGPLRDQISERSALKQGLAKVGAPRALRLVPAGIPEGPAYCAGCAAPIEFGAVLRGLDSYCSVECSLGGDRPA